MSSLRGRTRDSSWQWLVIGVILGLGCSSVACLGSYALGVIALKVPGIAVAEAPTPTVGPTATPLTIIITTTPLPTSVPATLAPLTNSTMAATAASTPAATNYVINATSAVAVAANGTMAATAAATQNVPPTAVPADPLSSGTSGGALNPPGATANAASGGSSLTELTRTELIAIKAISGFQMGTTQTEASSAVDDCVNRDKGKCAIGDASDSINNQPSINIDAFQIEKYEVSYDQYLTYLNSLTDSYKTACDATACLALQDNGNYKGSYIKLDGAVYKLTSPLESTHPVAFVTWYGADAYCKAIGRRLPTEAEWERAARSTDRRIYPWSSAWDGTKANTSRPSQGGSLPVDSYANGASEEGVVNLAGNVAEWVSDWYDPNFFKNSRTFTNPKGPAKGTQKVVRGGSWDEIPFFARAVQRQSHEPGLPTASIGFRCAADGTANSGGTSNGGTTGGAPPAAKATLAP